MEQSCAPRLFVSDMLGEGTMMRLICVIDNRAGGRGTWAEHGLCYWIQTGSGNLLWDTGSSGVLLEHNLDKLDLDPATLDLVALSHAHYDHTGGLDRLLELHPGLTIHAHRDIFVERLSRRDDQLLAIGLADREKALRAKTRFELADEATTLLRGVRTTGGIHQRPYPQGTSSHLLMRRGGALQPDDHSDDMSLVLQVDGGIVLLCGCCHAGLRNTLLTVREQYEAPLLAIVGGTHLGRATEGELQAIIECLEREGRPRLYLNHCTGEKALRWLWRAFGERAKPCPTGTLLEF